MRIRIMRLGAVVAVLGGAIQAIGCGGGEQANPSSTVPAPPAPDASNGSPATSPTTTIDSAALYQVIYGFGTTQRLFDDPQVTDTCEARCERIRGDPSPRTDVAS